MLLEEALLLEDCRELDEVFVLDDCFELDCTELFPEDTGWETTGEEELCRIEAGISEPFTPKPPASTITMDSGASSSFEQPVSTQAAIASANKHLKFLFICIFPAFIMSISVEIL